MDKQTEEQMAAELFAEIKNRKLETLSRYTASWVYGSLSEICKADGREITVEQMLRYSGQLESDLYMMFNS